MHTIRTHFYLLAITFLLGAAGGAIGWNLYRYRPCRDYSYIDPDMACGEAPAISKAAYVALANEILAFIEKQQAAGKVTKIGLFFRDLHNGPVFGINEDVEFIPASLMKLPTVLTYFDLAVDQPGILQTELLYKSEDVVDFTILQQIEPPEGSNLREGQRYTIEQLMRNAIVFSDNLAYYVLLEHLKKNVPEGNWRLERTFRALGIIDPVNIEAEVASAHGYAAIFRGLYHVSFLNAQDSEKMLSWLADSTYRKGLIAGVPEGTVVANKFGERYLSDGAKQLHDCGIIYYPKNPYVLCVMTKGYDWDSLRETIATISRMVYQEVNSRRR